MAWFWHGHRGRRVGAGVKGETCISKFSGITSYRLEFVPVVDFYFFFKENPENRQSVHLKFYFCDVAYDTFKANSVIRPREKPAVCFRSTCR